MANTNPNGNVAVIKTADLAALWGDEIVIKKSTKEGKRYPLYLSLPTGPVFLNTAKGQDFLLEHGVFSSPASPAPAPEDSPSESPVPVSEPAPAIPQQSPVKKPGTLAALLNAEIL